MSCFGYKYTERGGLKLYNRTVRSALCLSDPERIILLFILDRTIGWNRVPATISHSEFADGAVRRKKGKCVVIACGTQLPQHHVDDALMRLQERGAIEIERGETKVAYKINEHWCHPDLEASGMWEINESDYDYAKSDGDERPGRAR